MSRLTDKVRNFDGTASSKESLIDEKYHCPNDYCSKVLTKLADYEDKEEQGLLIELPCKVGDCVYRFCGSKGRKYVDIRYVNNITYRLDYKGDVVWEIFTTTTDVLGKTVFLTRSEAEEALAKMGGK